MTIQTAELAEPVEALTSAIETVASYAQAHALTSVDAILVEVLAHMFRRATVARCLEPEHA